MVCMLRPELFYGETYRNVANGYKTKKHHVMIKIWTDGSCYPNPGPGGYAALLIDGDGTRTEIVGYSPSTTNQRMELLAAIRGLQAADPTLPVTIYSDSEYVTKFGKKVVTYGKPKKTKVNRDLWCELTDTVSMRTAPITWTWVKAHSGIVNNEHVDALAGMARISQAA